MQEMRVWSLSGEDPLEKDMATHSSILAWRIPWTEEPGNGPWGCKELDMTEVTEHAPCPHLNLVISLKILSPMTVTFWSTGLWTSMHSLHMKSWKDTCQSLQPWQLQRSLKTPLTETSPFWGVGVSRSGLLDLVGGSRAWPHRTWGSTVWVHAALSRSWTDLQTSSQGQNQCSASEWGVSEYWSHSRGASR